MPDPPRATDIAEAIGDLDRADDAAALAEAATNAQQTIVAGLRGSIPAGGVAAEWSRMLRHTTAAAVRLTATDPTTPWTWFVSGSAARGEAVPGSDVETLLALADDVDDATKNAALALAAEVHALLERCGVNGDANGVLASRSRFCRRWSSWAESIGTWARVPQHDRGVVMIGVVADSTVIHRASTDTAEDALRARCLAAVGEHRSQLRFMLQDATAMRAAFPSRLRTFALGADTVDVKLAAIDPIVKTARWAGLAAGSTALSTPARLAAAARAAVLDAEDAASLSDCCEFLVRFRVHGRATAHRQGRPPSDVVVLAELAPQDRAQLRSVAREVAGIRRKLSYAAGVPEGH